MCHQVTAFLVQRFQQVNSTLYVAHINRRAVPWRLRFANVLRHLQVPLVFDQSNHPASRALSSTYRYVMPQHLVVRR
jgi:hypothetical protein